MRHSELLPADRSSLEPTRAPRSPDFRLLRRRILTMLLVVIASVSSWSQEPEPAGTAGLRIGLRASPSDFSPVLGFAVGKLPFEATLDYWIRLGYYDATVEIEPHHRAHFKEFRHGFVLGGRYDFGGRDFGLTPGAGLEWVGGDYAGLELDPEYEIMPWGGISLRMPRRNFLGVRLMASEGVLGWFRIEWTKDFR